MLPPHNLRHKTQTHKIWNVAINSQIWNYIRAARDKLGPLFTLFPCYRSPPPPPATLATKLYDIGRSLANGLCYQDTRCVPGMNIIGSIQCLNERVNVFSAGFWYLPGFLKFISFHMFWNGQILLIQSPSSAVCRVRWWVLSGVVGVVVVAAGIRWARASQSSSVSRDQESWEQGQQPRSQPPPCGLVRHH